MDKYRYRRYIDETGFENRFADEKEIKKVLSHINYSQPVAGPNKGGMPFISDAKSAWVDNADYHTLILGSTGSMKTRVLILPTIFTLGFAGENMVISDPKGELFEKSSGYLKSQGYKINVINLRDMEKSDSWNPFAESYKSFHAGKVDEAKSDMMDFVETLFSDMKATSKDMFWPLSSIQLANGLSELMLRLSKNPDECNPASMAGMINHIVARGGEHETSYESLGTEIANKLEEGTSLHANLSPTLSMSAKLTLDGIKSNTTTGFDAFTKSTQLMALSSNTTFNLHDFAKPNEKHVVYLITPDENTKYHFFAATFVRQLYTLMIRDSAALPGQALPNRLNFVLDEFANFPRIDNMQTMITAARSRNIRFYLVVQSNNQLKAVYNKDAETIKTNCLNWIYLSTKEDELIKQVMKMTGNIDDNAPLISYQKLSSFKKVDSREHPDKAGAEALILISRERPYVSFLPDVSRYKAFVDYPPAEYPKLKEDFSFFSLRKRLFRAGYPSSELRALLNENPTPDGKGEKKEEKIAGDSFNDILDKLAGRK